MKHIRKFNENIAQKHLKVIEVLKDIFAELIDDASIQVNISLESIVITLFAGLGYIIICDLLSKKSSEDKKAFFLTTNNPLSISLMIIEPLLK